MESERPPQQNCAYEPIAQYSVHTVNLFDAREDLWVTPQTSNALQMHTAKLLVAQLAESVDEHAILDFSSLQLEGADIIGAADNTCFKSLVNTETGSTAAIDSGLARLSACVNVGPPLSASSHNRGQSVSVLSAAVGWTT